MLTFAKVVRDPVNFVALRRRGRQRSEKETPWENDQPNSLNTTKGNLSVVRSIREPRKVEAQLSGRDGADRGEGLDGRGNSLLRERALGEAHESIETREKKT